jgi:mRNA interferase MazF
MEKDFDGWNIHKKLVENAAKKILFKEGEVWWCSVGTNVGNESCGKGTRFRRPVLVIKKLSGKNCIGIPLSTQEKIGSWFMETSIRGKTRWVLLHQIRMFSVQRFEYRLGKLEPGELRKIREKLKTLLELF